MIIKNSNIRRMLFDNRYRIFMIIIAIILIFSIIRVLNSEAKKELEQKLVNAQNANKITTGVEESYQPQKTVISGSDITQKEQENNTEVIDQFMANCNNQEIEKAYRIANKCM